MKKWLFFVGCLISCFWVKNFTYAESITNELPVLPYSNNILQQRFLGKDISSNEGVQFTPSERARIKEIQRNFQTIDNSKIPTSKFSVEPVVDSNKGYSLGEINHDTLKNALDNLNYYRFVAYQSPLDINDPDIQQKSQSAAVGMGAANLQSHGLGTGAPTYYPLEYLKPKNMSSEMWKDAVDNTNASLLHSSHVEKDFNYHTQSYLGDRGTGNILVGHRAWLLNPKLQHVGFGYSPADGTQPEKAKWYNAMYVWDDSANPVPKDMITTWPSKGAFPIQSMSNEDLNYFNETQRWSIHLNSSGYQPLNAENITVELKKENTNQIWNFSKQSSDGDFHIEGEDPKNKDSANAYYRTITFQPGTNEKPFDYKVGDRFNVSVKGINDINGNSIDYNYSTVLFNVDDPLIDVPATDIKLSTDATSLTVGDTKKISAEVLPQNATDKTLAWSSADSSIASVNSQGEITAQRTGTTIITAQNETNNIEKSISITVNKKLVSPQSLTYLLSNYGNINIGDQVKLYAYPSNYYETEKQQIIYKIAPGYEKYGTIDSSGLFTAKERGIAYITATTSDGKANLVGGKVGISVGTGHWFDPVSGFDFPIYLGNEPRKTVPVTSCSLDKKEITVNKGDIFTLNGTVLPNEATNKYMHYLMEDPSIVYNSSSNNFIAKDTGTTVVTILTADGQYTDTCQVTVK